MSIEAYEVGSDCLHIRTSQGQIKISPLDAGILHVLYTMREAFSEQPSLIAPAPRLGTVSWEASDRDGALHLTTAELHLSVDRETAAFTYRDLGGTLLTREPARGGKTLDPVDVVKTRFDSQAELEAHTGADGVRVRAMNSTRFVDRQDFRAKLEFEWQAGEALYGLGSHEEGIMNLRGTQQYLYQQNMKAVVPMLVSTNGYGVLLDACSLITFHDDQYGSYLWADIVPELDYYFIYGPDLDRVVARYRQLTGPVPMPPKWAFGYIQSKERYHTQEELIAVAGEYRRRQIPLDAMVLDWHSWTGDLWGQKSLDPARFPDPPAMMAALHGMHAKLMISIWPIMSNGGPNQIDMKDHGFLLGNQATYDAFSEGARSLYWKQVDEGLFRHGIDAVWCDCTEPFEADWAGAVKPEPEERLRINTEEAKQYLDPGYINAYSLLHSQGIYEGQRASYPEKRVLNLTRSAFAGQSRYGTITWSGDTTASWETLRKQIPAGLNFCATGEPYWTLDVGGFFVANKGQWFWSGEFEAGREDLGYRELYVRWLEYATFLPMLRPHGTDTPREVWRFGEPGSQTYEAIVQFIRLRYRMLPYIYSLAGWVTQHEYTMLRPLAFDFAHDTKVHDIADQYMFGPALLVCPVTVPMYYGPGSAPLIDVPATREVYLPEGGDWYDFWTGAPYAGGRTIVAEAPLERIPVYVRAGSILPLGPAIQHTSEVVDCLEIRVYGGAGGRFELYDDEGDGYAYERGAFATVLLTWDDERGMLTIGPRSGAFHGMRQRLSLQIVLISSDSTVVPDAAARVERLVDYTGEKVVLHLLP